MDIRGQAYVNEGYCFVMWKREADGAYKIYVDVYSPLRFEPQEA